MQRIVARRVLAETNYVRLQLRCFTLAGEDNNYETLPPVIPPFPYVPPPYNGPTTEQILAERKEFLSPAMVTYYKKPLNLVAGKMQYVFDENGKRYLDAFGAVSVLSCGHCHPGVLEPLVEQLNTIQHTNVLYLNHCVTDYAKALASKLPGNLKVAYFTNSGSEANELAILMARLYTGCNDIISLQKAYHGITPDAMGTNGLSTCKFNVVQTGIHHAMDPDPYRGIFGSDGEKYAENVQSLINFGTSGRVAGFISEAIQGVGGVVELAPGYLPAVYESVRKAGGLCIADEAISGFGRTGSHFWAFEAQGVVPDIVTMAKGIANGSPIGAVVTTPEIAQVMGPSSGHSYGSTFAGNLGSTTAALAVLNVIEKEKLQHNAQKVGSHLKRRLTALMDKHEIIGDVRGRGFFLGVEFVTDRQLKIPATNETSVIMEQMKDLGVLVGSCGYHKNVMRILPPLCSTKADADFIADVLDYILSDLNNSG